MSSDSVDQWSQALGARELADWHPVLDTLWIRLWSFARTPAVPIAVQILLLAAVVARGCRLQRAIGIPDWIVTFEALAVALAPVTVALELTLWKDIPYSIAVLAGTLLLWLLWRMPWRASRPAVSLSLGLLVGAMLAFRHNGFVAAICTVMAALWLAWPERRRLIWSATVGAATSMMLHAGAVAVTGAIPMPPGVAVMGYLAAHVAAKTPRREGESRELDELYPLAETWPYQCGLTGPLIFTTGFRKDHLAEQRWEPLILAAKLTWRRPSVSWKHFVCASRLLWDPTFGQSYTMAIWQQSDGQYRSIPDNPFVSEHPLSVPMREWLLSSLMRTTRRGWIELWWSPAIPLYLCLIACALVCLRERDLKVMALTLPLVGQSVAIAPFLPSLDVRYQFAAFLIALLLVPGLLYLALARDAKLAEKGT